MKIVSGGQTGVDRAALDAALSLSVPCGGYCPKGRRAEDGKIGEKYPLKETASAEYEVRTELNVKESDATLVITRGKPTKGTAFTIAVAKINKKPRMVVDLDKSPADKAVQDICAWIAENKIKVLNVAGPRESNLTGIYNDARSVLVSVLQNQKSLRE